MNRLFLGVAVLLSSLVTGQTNDATAIRGTDQARRDSSEPLNLTSKKGLVLEDGTPVKLRLNRTLSSADSHVGDTVDFEAMQDVSVNGILVIPKGSFAFGIVTEVQPKKRVARGGKLELKLEYVQLIDGGKVSLRAVAGGKGHNHAVVMTTGIVASGLFFFPAAPFFLMMHGKEMVIPKGAEVIAYVNGDATPDTGRLVRSSSPAMESTESSLVAPLMRTTQVESGAPSGSFVDHTYTNEYFAMLYPVAPEWVVETHLIRKQFDANKSSDARKLLLAAVHIPQDLTDLRADSSFVMLAEPGSLNCGQYIDTLGTNLDKPKIAERKGEVSEYTVAGHEFFRANFEFASGTRDRAVICSPARDYLLVWKIEGAFRESVDEAASTTYAIVPWPAAEPQEKDQIHISANTSAEMLRKKVLPVYPAEAQENHIQGKVRMEAAITEKGDVANLELLDGPLELATSAVTAVRQWKYHPYRIGRAPVAVHTEVVVTYELGPL